MDIEKWIMLLIAIFGFMFNTFNFVLNAWSKKEDVADLGRALRGVGKRPKNAKRVRKKNSTPKDAKKNED